MRRKNNLKWFKIKLVEYTIQVFETGMKVVYIVVQKIIRVDLRMIKFFESAFKLVQNEDNF